MREKIIRNIELELRAEVFLSQFTDLLKKLKRQARLISCTKRLSVMFLGEINNSSVDIRVRIDSNGKSEVVVKKGDFHAHDRIEASQGINKDQFVGIVKTFSIFGFHSKITERENFVFDLDNDINLTLVKAGKFFYVEIEKMSNKKEKKENKNKLLKIFSDLNLKPIKNKTEFNELCERLSKYSDWFFDGSKKHFKKLLDMLSAY